MARKGAAPQYRNQYGNLVITVWSEEGIYYATVLQPATGYEVTFSTIAWEPRLAAHYALHSLAGDEYPEISEEKSEEWAEAVNMLGADAAEALEELKEVEMEGARMGTRYQIECNFECPGGKIEQFPIWPRKGEKTMDETCLRGLREYRHLDEYQISLCKKGIHKRLY